ncbi:MAG: hypothetical protein ABJC26_07885 [Gemmatimonadaceae bacterium]
MQNPRKLVYAGAFATIIVALAYGQSTLGAAITRQAVQAPTFEVDPFWPKPLPNHWILGSAIGVGVDSKDHIFIIHRGAATMNARTEVDTNKSKPAGDCCSSAPPILEFDQEGNLVNSWGGPGKGFTWPESNHGITIDDKDNVWIGGNGTGDSHILKFTHEGKFLQEIGVPGRATNSNSMDAFGKVAKISFDIKANEAYIADGYGNKRVAVIDMTSGNIKRYWGAYGNKPEDANLGPYKANAPLAQQFRNPVHCAEPSNDGLVYVCDRPNDRIQVFSKDGKFVKEKRIAINTVGDGSVWDIAFSKDPAQKFMFLADGKNEKIYVIDRASLEILTSFGDAGRQPGQFFAVHSIATDSKGNVFTTETYEGKRVQKFTYKGVKPVSKENQGVLWPLRR